MAVRKLSQIANAPAPPALTDTAVGVGGGTTDYQFTWAQVKSTVSTRVKLTATTTIFVSNLSGTIVGGSGYTAGTYLNVALTGGSGSGATADIIIAGGAVTLVRPRPGATGYSVGNVLSAATASIGGTGSGFTFTLTAIGNDSTANGFSASTPFATLRGAYGWAQQNLDINGQILVLQLVHGVYGSLYYNNGWVGDGFLQVIGDATNVDACVVDGTIDGFDYTFYNLDPLSIVADLAEIQIRTGGIGIFNFSETIIVRLFNNLSGGGNLHFYFRGSGGAQISMATGAQINDFANTINLDYTDTGAAAQRAFLDADGICYAQWGAIKAITGSPSWSDGFFKLNDEAVVDWNMNASLSYAGATGKKAILESRSVLRTFGAGAAGLPGSNPVQLLGGQWFDTTATVYDSACFFQVITGTFSNLPSPVSYPGSFARISDSTTNTVGANVTVGGGAITVTLLSDGTNWRVLTGY